jgi:hypothetical protein
MHFKLGRSGRAVIFGLACWLLAPWSAWAQSPPSDLSPLKAEMKVFEAVVDGTLAQTFAPPFGLLEKTKGTYLPGFGLVFSLEVNLYPMRTPNPFNMSPLSKGELDKAQEAMRERIVTIRQSVPRLLADHAVSLRHLGSGDSVAVVVHLFEMQSGDAKLPDQLVITIRKSDLDQFWDKKITYQDLTAKMTILEI